MYYIVELNTITSKVILRKEVMGAADAITETYDDYLHVLRAIAKKANIFLNDTLLRTATVDELGLAISSLLNYSITRAMNTGNLKWTFTIIDNEISVTLPTDSKDNLKCVLGLSDAFGIPVEYLIHQINDKWNLSYSKQAFISLIEKNDLYWLWVLKNYPFVDVEPTLFVYLMGSNISKEGVQYDDLNMTISKGEFIRAVDAHFKRLNTPTFVEKLQMIIDKDYRIKLSFVELTGVIIIGGIFGVIITSVVFFILGEIT